MPHLVRATPAEIKARPVPNDVQVDPAFAPFLMGQAIGTQGYVCVAGGTAFS